MSGKEKYPKEKIRQRLILNLAVMAIVLLLLVLTLGLVFGLGALLIHLNVLQLGPVQPDTSRLLWWVALASVLLGSALSVVISRIPLKPVNQVITAMKQMAAGDFQTRLQFGKRFGRTSIGREISESFNKMAEELQNTEMLRGDFVNNFSHEFQTPIVSIAGFASLLRRGNLPEDQRREYLEAIEEESMRLSALASNVLNLSKVENQTILRQKSRFNLSEQIRSCILLLERKWNAKHLDLSLDFDEYTISADQELLEQVWINLLDNAVKFTPEYGLIRVVIQPGAEDIRVAIMNAGSVIPPDKRERIFQKFYQADESHATQGSGVGLAVVKRVVELHQGQIKVSSDENSTTFTVTLPF